MSFTFPTDSNNKAGAVRLNPGGTGFHVPSVLYSEDGVTPSRVRKTTVYNPTGIAGSAYILEPGEEKIFVENHEFSEGTGSWGVSFAEYNQNSDVVLRNVKIKIVMSNTSNGFNLISGSHDVTFSKTFTLSELDEVDKGLLIPSVNLDSAGSNVLLFGKPYNVPLGKFIQVTIISNSPNPTYYIKGFRLTEMGWF